MQGSDLAGPFRRKPSPRALITNAPPGSRRRAPERSQGPDGLVDHRDCRVDHVGRTESMAAQAAKEAEAKTQEWLAILARCFQLQDAIAVLELDRVRETAPDDLDGHRLGLKAARKDRLDSISRSTDRLLLRMGAAAASANLKVLLNPSQSPAVVKSNAHVAAVVNDFHERLGIEDRRGALETRRWVEAAADVRDKAREAGSERVDAAKRLGGEARDRARSMKGKLSTGIAERALRRRTEDDQLNVEG